MKLLITFLLLPLTCIAQVKWPPVTQENKPWTRWWWQGSAVTKAGLDYNLQQYAEAGLGGVEITPIYGVKGYEDSFITFLSPRWMNLFDYTLQQAKSLGLGVDLANATGWPFGGPWVSDSDASKTMYYKTYLLQAGQQLNEPVLYYQHSLVRTANNRQVNADTVLQPLYTNKNLQQLALDQIQFAGNLPLQFLAAYPAAGGTMLDLTNKVDAKGILHWTAPQGSWRLYALFPGLHGKMVERAAPGGEGYAIDHFSAPAVNNYLHHFDRAFKGNNVSYLRAFFNDSYEVDDARGQANWTPQLFEEFKKRKGYDLKEYLPALLNETVTDTGSRVLYDYRSVIDDMLLENFTKQWKQWAFRKNMMVRNQSHGSPANTLDLYSAVDIPETEGTDILRFKFATSAANVTGKKLVSSESATWLNEHFLSSLGDVKQALDKYFLGGVNHIFYHGTAYSPPGAPWPGWLFYAAVHFQPTNPQWQHFHALNAYVARVQSFLQSAHPDNDILLYYPIVDRYTQKGNALLQHFDGMENNFEGTDFEYLSKMLLQKGYTFDFFSDRQLQLFTVTKNHIITGGNTYNTILLPANKYIPAKSFEKLLQLAAEGVSILFYKQLPANVPGLYNLNERRKRFKNLFSQLHFSQDKALKSVQKTIVGKGAFYYSDNFEDLLSITTVRKESMVDSGLQFYRKKNGMGSLYFIANTSDKQYEGWATINTIAADFALFSPMTATAGKARWKTHPASQKSDVFLQLQPHESVILQAYNSKQPGEIYPYRQAAGTPIAITGKWALKFISGGPALPHDTTIDALDYWTNFAGDDVKNFSGTAQYGITFPMPASNAGSWLLNLGAVHETAEVFLNGRSIATLTGPIYRVVIERKDLLAGNRLDIVVANLMANRISYMDRLGLPWKIFYNINMPARKKENRKNDLFDASEWKPMPSGLAGPLTLTPLEEIK
ncbi:MAG TPA: glycosyl hydrolase [Chitinophagaceae bacterium]|nr:glycosyl hydrolase [Chitinophagaceae bacterium]